MQRAEALEQLAAHYEQLAELRRQIVALRCAVQPDAVEDYSFAVPEGEVRLSELFGEKDTLFVVHNMGKGCSYCTLWADGLNGVLGHLEDRAAFVLSSPDDPETQQAFAASRGWGFRMVSVADSRFAADMGYFGDQGWWPGVSVFRRRDGEIVRVSDTEFGPGDDFCAVWHLFDLIPEGPDGWQPKYAY